MANPGMIKAGGGYLRNGRTGTSKTNQSENAAAQDKVAVTAGRAKSASNLEYDTPPQDHPHPPISRTPGSPRRDPW